VQVAQATHEAPFHPCGRRAGGKTENTGRTPPLPADDVEALASRYEQHIEREEHELLPTAAALVER